MTTSPANDNLTVLRVDGPLGPVSTGITYLVDGLQAERALGVDVAFDLFGRRIAAEWTTTKKYAGYQDSVGDNDALLIKADLLKLRTWKLWASYADAGAGYQPPAASISNPYAHTYSEGLFDRPAAIGAPMQTNPGIVDVVPGGGIGDGDFIMVNPVGVLPMTSNVWEVGLEGPGLGGYWKLDWYTGDAAGVPSTVDANGAAAGGIVNIGGGNLGDVFSIGYTRPLVPGVDLELKYGKASFDNNTSTGLNPIEDITYFRIGSKLSF